MKEFNSLMDIIESRKSIRSYKPQEVEEEKLDYILQAFRKAPSAKNIQPWKLVVVRNEKIIKDLALALEHLILAATEKGLGTCWIGAFKEKLVKDILSIPENIRAVALTPVGYPAREGGNRGRKPLSEIVSYNKYIE